MAYLISGTVVVDNSGNINSTGIATATGFVGKGMIEAGTVCYFFQANAPTGFTKLTTSDDCTLRVVSGSGGSVGGATSFTTAFPASPTPLSITQTYGATTLTTPQLPSHTHPRGVGAGTAVNSSPGGGARSFPATGSTGLGDTHDHPSSSLTASADLRVQYIDIIAASRDA